MDSKADLLPEDFAALPHPEQRRILDAGLLMTQMAYRHAGAVIIGLPPSRNPVLSNGSCFILKLRGCYYLGTAWHVVASYLKRRSGGEPVLFEVRDASLHPERSVVWKDEENDIVFLSLSHAELQRIGLSICEPLMGWPPPHPQAKSYVLVSGFPAVIRERVTRERVDFHALSTLLQVTTVGERHIVCQFEREHWITYNHRGVPPRGTELSGMSGGPVFLVGNLAYPLVAMVSGFSANFELLYIKTLSHLPDVLESDSQVFGARANTLGAAGRVRF